MQVVATCLTACHVALAAGPVVWVEAELFEQKGGWVVDGQFIDQMGSSYLLANGGCKPVADAQTDVTIEQAGRYILRVRCRNWLVKHSPGRFQVMIGSKASPVTFGAQANPHWTWMDGGTFDLKPGKHRVTLHDLTGDYGRCDALVLTTDATLKLPDDGAELNRIRRTLSGVRQTVEDRGSYDVVVIGGGVAGCCAAISSARHGAKTVLIQDRPVLGGNTSDEIRVWVQGAAGGRLRNAREGGLVEEILLRAKVEGSESKALAKMVGEVPGLTVCLLTRATRAVCGKTGHIDAVEAIHVVTAERSVFRGRIFIDCTGDGVIGASAGAIYRMGREGKDEFDESIAPDKPDRRTLGSSLLWACENAGEPVTFTAPEWAIRFPSCKDLPHRGHQPPTNGHWWVEFGGGAPPPELRDVVDDPNQLNTITDAEEIRDYLLRVLYGVWDHIKNRCDRKQLAADYRLTWVGHVAGKRESRRLIGDTIMVEDDILSARVFPDQVAYGGWSIDLHPPDGIHDPGRPSIHHFFSKPYSIPLRSLYSKNVDNLMMAGRNISVSHVALGTTRVMGTCGVIGQAVGTAAAMCIKHAYTPRQLAASRIQELQQALLKDDGYLIGLRNQDPADLARTATVTASSTRKLYVARPDIQGQPAHAMVCPRAEMFRVSADRIEAIRVYVIWTGDEPVSLMMGLRRAKAHADFSGNADVARAMTLVPPKHRGWVTFQIGRDTQPGEYYWLHLPVVKGMHLQLMAEAPPGSCRAYRNSAGWQVMPAHYAFATDPPIEWPGAWEPAGVIDGVSRPVGDDWHMWASDPNRPLPQWLELDLGAERRISEIRLTFDSDFGLRNVPERPVPQMVRDYRVLRAEGDRWVEVLQERDNILRHRVHRFEPVQTRRIRIEVQRTHGAGSAHIFEVRVYE